MLRFLPRTGEEARTIGGFCTSTARLTDEAEVQAVMVAAIIVQMKNEIDLIKLINYMTDTATSLGQARPGTSVCFHMHYEDYTTTLSWLLQMPPHTRLRQNDCISSTKTN